MSIPPEITIIIVQLQHELQQIKDQTNQGLALLRPLMRLFPENETLNQFFAYFNTVLFFVVDSERRIQITQEYLTLNPKTVIIQEAGEDLSHLLGKVLETKMRVEGILQRLEQLS